MKKIILASESPRRKELLEKTGLKFTIVKSFYKENLSLDLNPHDLTRKFSLEKAKTVSKNYKNSIIISADTVVSFDGTILVKPKNKKDAKRMLSLLSNTYHLIITAFTIIDTDSNKIITKSEETKVSMRKITEKEIDLYVKTREPFDKAGAYAIQGIASKFIKKVEGDYSNAIGLPIKTVLEELKKLGVKVL